jgi:hypothetical protein
MPAAGTSTVSRSTSMVISTVGSASMAPRSGRTTSSGTTTGTSPFLVQLLRKMSAEAGRDHGVEPALLDGPHGVLARRAGAEVGAGHQDARARVALVVEHERGRRATCENRPFSKPVRSTRLSHSAGMIWSVSTSLRSSGTPRPCMT